MRVEGCVKGQDWYLPLPPSAISIRKTEKVLPHLLWAQPQAQGRASAGIPPSSSERVRSTDLVGKTPGSQRHVVVPVWVNSDLSVSRELHLGQSDLNPTCRRTILSSHQQLHDSCLIQQGHPNILKHSILLTMANPQKWLHTTPNGQSRAPPCLK